MVQVEIVGPAGSRKLVFDKSEVSIGRVQGNDIVLTHASVSKRHGRLVVKDGKLIMVDLKSTNGTFVNARRITSPLVIRATDKIRIGEFVLVFGLAEADEPDEEDDTLEVDATELRLLAAIAQRDEASRTVYADWLEQQGRMHQAEFLRAQEALVIAEVGSEEFRTHSQQMRELAERLEVTWRYKVARPVVENCLAVELECPREWGSLEPTEQSNVRYCGACAKRVYYSNTVEAAREHVARGRCVAIDIVQLRRPNDLEPVRRHQMMGAFVMPPSPPPLRTK
ncbi:MAG: FHA domain-containing protein [Kofleriaceae bacterium]